MVTFTGVVIDHVENDLDVGGVERLHHFLEFADLPAEGSGPGVSRVRGKKADGIVSPVVGKSFVLEELIVDEMMNGQEFHGRDPEFPKIVNRGIGPERGISAT